MNVYQYKMKYKNDEDDIIYLDDICIFLCFFIALAGVLFLLVSNCEKILTNVTMKTEWVQSITSIQITISLLSITIMELLLNEGDTRILGISYKYLFFRKSILGGLNVISCMMYMLLMMLISIIGSFFFCGIASMCLVGKIVVLLSLTISFFLMIYMISLGLVAKYKKSILFDLVYKKLCNSNDKIYNKIMSNLDINNKGLKVHNKYLREEYILLGYIFLNIKTLEGDTEKEMENKCKNEERIQVLIDTDTRSTRDVIQILQKVGEKEFKGENDKILKKYQMYMR